MRPSPLTRRHLWIWLALLAFFTLCVGWWAGSNLARHGKSAAWIALTTLSTLAGPMTGAVAREGQRCCVAFSLSLVPWLGSALVLGIAFQWLPLPDQRWARALRLGVWSLAWTAWFGGGIVSFLHALE